jgi:tetratricopeptide (TPR) repeat protein
VRALRAYVEAIGDLGNYYHRQYNEGNRDVIDALGAEEPNLLRARHLARVHGWWQRVIDAMQGLNMLYGHTGRRAEWARRVEEIVPDFVDPATARPLPGREEQWDFITHYRVQLAMEAREWREAERLQRTHVDWNRERAAAALAIPLESLNGVQRNTIRSLAVSLEQLGHIQREQGQPDCVASYEEAIPLYQRVGDHAAEAVVAFNLGHAYLQIADRGDLAQAERWYRRSLELHDERDRLGRGKCLITLGIVSSERFREARAADKPAEEPLRYLNDAAQFYRQALDLLPPNAVNDLAVTHNQLGLIYGDAGDLDRALSHYRESIRYEEMQGNLYGAAQTRFNVAIGLANAGRLADALLYAQAALRNFTTYGDRAAAEVQETQGLIEWIESLRGENR